MKVFALLLASILLPLAVYAQDRSSDELFPPAKVEENVLAQLEIARYIRLMDATPSGSHWFVVDEFAGWQHITIDGKPFEQQYNEVTSPATKLSPNGKYVIWTGLTRGYTVDGFDSTVATVYKNDSLVGNYVADYPSVEFSHSGNRWATLLPYAFQNQKGDRDLVIVDGHVGSKGANFPHQFSFSHDEKEWAYRSTDGLNENIVTDNGQVSLLYKRGEAAAAGSWDPTVWRYTPDVTIMGKMLEGRDYDLHFEHVARQYRTAYSLRSSDTARTYINYAGKNHGLYRWVTNVVMDTAGKHIAYFACDPDITRRDSLKQEQNGVVVYDGKVVAGPYIGVSRLFLSQSGQHFAYSLSKLADQFYIDKKLAAKTSQVMDCIWSPDESRVAYLVVGAHDRLFVVSGGRRSPLYEQVGRIGWDAKGKYVEFVGVKNGKLVHVKL